MIIKLIDITPDMARKMLEKNSEATNRPVREKYVEVLANAMRHGHWVTTHQGIAIDENGILCDGQHRLLAIIMADVTVKMYVFYGLRTKQENGIFTFDAIDRGILRCVGDQLTIRHGIPNGRRIAAICSGLTYICLRDPARMTVQTAVEVYDIFKKSIMSVYPQISGCRFFQQRTPTAALIFCYNAMPDELTNFPGQCAAGENLKKGDPAHTLRAYLLNNQGVCAKNWFYSPVATACMYYVRGEKLLQIKHSMSGVDFFKNKQIRTINKVKALFGREE
jgi:hypothetical protein